MATYTTIELTDLNSLIRSYGIGEGIKLTPVSAGIENSTYFLETRLQGRSDSFVTTQFWVLTIYEQRSTSDVAFVLKLHQWLRDAYLPVAHLPAPLLAAGKLAQQDANTVLSIQGKPAALFEKLPGSHPERITPRHCAAVGTTLAKFHQACRDFPEQHPNLRGLQWVTATAQTQLQTGQLQPEEHDLLLSVLDRLNPATDELSSLPQAVIHGDCFPDNVLFKGETLSGLIDFDNACTDAALLDLSIAMQAWCFNQDQQADPEKTQALLKAYQNIRPLTPEEQHAWPMIQVWSATRFWLSRLQFWATSVHENEKHSGHPKHPNHYRAILNHALHHPIGLPSH